MGIDCGSLGKSNTLDGLRAESKAAQESRDSGPGRLGGGCRERVAQGAPGFFNLSGPPGVGTPRGPEEQ